MKTTSKVVSVSVLALAGALVFTSCANPNSSNSTSSAKIGVVLVGDETEGYTKAHMDGIDAAAKKLNIADRITYKKKVLEDNSCKTAIDDLLSDDCGLIVANSYGHQDYMAPAAKANPNETFISMTGDYAAVSKLSNFKNAFVSIYEARYVSGIVAGMKLKELADGGKLDTAFNQDANGNWKIGYVGAYKYAEVVSGYTAFYLGVKSIVSKVSMQVQFTSSWFDIAKEGAAADTLVKNGCVIIGQHADSTGAPAKVQSLLNTTRTDNASKKYICYSVGFNIDMIPTAKDAALTSALNNWEVYYEHAFSQYLNGKAIETDWCQGYADDAVGISKLNTSCAAGTQAAVDTAVTAIKAGTLHVFDTSKFTVDGKTVTSAKIDLSHYDYSTGSPVLVYQGETVEAIKTENKVSYFSESTLRSAPYFALAIDGISQLN